MANTYTQLYIQLIFAVQNRSSLIHDHWELQLHKYITGIVHNRNHKLLAINGMPDHLHILVGLHPNDSIAQLVMMIKRDSSAWINKNNFIAGKFNWQEGYGAFSYSKSMIDNVYRYIQNQKHHHQKETFQQEYLRFLKKFDINFDERYVFKPI